MYVLWRLEVDVEYLHPSLCILFAEVLELELIDSASLVSGVVPGIPHLCL